MLRRSGLRLVGEYKQQFGLDLAGKPTKELVHGFRGMKDMPLHIEDFDPATCQVIASTQVRRDFRAMREWSHTLKYTSAPSRMNRKYRLGFVPTMGALHEGHIALIEASMAECVNTAVSIFVNPKQFNNPQDLASYPDTLQRDLRILAEMQVDLVYLPKAEEVYPKDFKMAVTMEGFEHLPEAANRPGHFTGVATVCNKLFNIVSPDMVYVGQKDALQCVVLKQLVRDMNYDMGVMVCPTVRELDGVAMSSRNVKLSPEQRADAPNIFAALEAVNRPLEPVLRSGFRERLHLPTAKEVREKTRGELEARLQIGEIEYVSVGHKETMMELEDDDEVEVGTHLSVVVVYGGVRLLDVIRLGVSPNAYLRQTRHYETETVEAPR